MECSIPQVMGFIGLMLVGSLTALNSTVVLFVQSSSGGAPSRRFLLRSLGMWLVFYSLPFAYLPFLECQPLYCMRTFRSWTLVSGGTGYAPLKGAT